MRLSYQWLNEYVDLSNIAPEDLGEKLTSVGLAVDAVEYRNQGVSGVVIGEVKTCVQHPNADRLRVCEVDTGSGEWSTIVCGAPNVAAGQRIAVALPGANLPGGKIGNAKLRGVESAGMLCSAKEIGLETKLLPKEQTEGLYVLPADAPIGQSVVEYLNLDDVIFEIDLTPNRSDCMSIRGLAYEVAAIYGREVTMPVKELHGADEALCRVQIETEKCSLYEAQTMDNAHIGPSPLWMQMRLLASGIRPINNIVDVTNYVMLEWGQPLHAFDFDAIQDKTIVVRSGRPSETIVTLDGTTRALDEETIVIADAGRAIGIAGVMGGENSEVSSDTRRIVLESAAFDARSVRRTGGRLGLRSEAQQRFEKGIDPVAIHSALCRAVELLESLGAAKVNGPFVSEGRPAHQTESVTISFSPSRCNELLGTSISTDDMQTIFTRLGFQIHDTSSGPSSDAFAWEVDVPSRRPDIRIEEDLVEEIGRMYGLDNVPATLPFGPTTVGVRTTMQKLRKWTREKLISSGMLEVVTYSFAHPDDLKPLRLDEKSDYRTMIPLMRPLSEERTHLRTHLLPGLCKVASYNLARGVLGGQIFEVGHVFWPKELPISSQPVEKNHWAGLWFGTTEDSFGVRARAYDFFDAKGTVEQWLNGFGWLDDTEFRRGNATFYHPTQNAELLISGKLVGMIGSLHPETLRALDIPSAIYAEFDLDLLETLVSDDWKVRKLPKVPAVRRDLAVLVNQTVAAADLLKVAVETVHDVGILESSRIFDVYAGKGIPDGFKSVALSFIYRAEDRTLTDDEVSAAHAEILKALEGQFGATLRS